ncbi:uncharacterized protein LOC126325861 isoform X2 [Schistocerca gregaria]|uniref:uncharacterized protein LOC126325861 isoform X2 n=1 Tax=Schistocerca gregaria TaxID=7010 RepID=UPI00211E2927|nr:uncharacterized protein LOC126325861 isoform X2 [Schistocerca gregaria]
MNISLYSSLLNIRHYRLDLRFNRQNKRHYQLRLNSHPNSRKSPAITDRLRQPLNIRANATIDKFASKRLYTTTKSLQIPQSANPLLENAVLPIDSAALETNIYPKILDPSLLPFSPDVLPAHIWFFIQEELWIPIWAAIALTTLSIRILALPVFIYQVRNMAILRMLSPKIQMIKTHINQSKYKDDLVMTKYWKDQLNMLYKIYQVSPLKNFTSLIVTLPLNAAQFLAARFLIVHAPELLSEPAPFWFNSLTSVDTYFLPAIYVILQLSILAVNLPAHTIALGKLGIIPTYLKLGLAIYVLVLAFLATKIPVIMAAIWIPSMLFTLISGVLFRLPTVCGIFSVALQLPTKRPQSLPPPPPRPSHDYRTGLLSTTEKIPK